MAENLLNQIMKYFSEDTINSLTQLTGGSQSGVQNALSTGLPAILGGLIKKTSDPQSAQSIFNMIKGNDGSVLNNLQNLSSSGTTTNSIVTSGGNFLNSIFGNKVADITNSLSGSSGLNSGSVKTILSVIGSVVMGFLAKYMTSNGISGASGLTSLLSGQAGFLKGLIPTSLLGTLGLSSLFSGAGSVTEDVKSGSSKFIWILLGLAALIALGYFLSKGCNKDNIKGVNLDTVKKTVVQKTEQLKDTVSKILPEWASLGNFSLRKLPDGISINIPELGVENKLIGFIEDKSKAADKETWFSFDRITFETNKASLKPESMDQIKNIAAIMKAYPNVELKIGGYTDNTGNADANMKLSQERANSVMNAIVNLGIDQARLKAEGYGQQHPVADNSTEEGRQQNRRIDVRVTKK